MLEGLELIEKVNELLKELPSLDAVGKRLGISRKTIARRCEKAGYKYSKDRRAYENIKVIPKEYSKNNTNVIGEVAITKVIPNEYYNNNMEIIENNTKVIPKEFAGLQKEDVYNLKLLLDNIEDILDLVKKKTIIIDLPLESTPFKTTINVNHQVWQDFNRKCDELRYYNKSDLLSVALQDFIKKY